MDNVAKKLNELAIILALFSQLPNGNKYKATQMNTAGGTIADVLTMYENGRTSEYEIKTSVSDFRADKKKFRKHQMLAEGKPNWYLPNRFYYVMPSKIHAKVATEIPVYAGAVVVNEFDKRWNGYQTNNIHIAVRAPLIHKEVNKDKWVEQFARSMSNRWFYNTLKYEDRYYKDPVVTASTGAKIPDRPIDQSIMNPTSET